MMMSLFSVFDPAMKWNLPLGWMSMFLVFLMWPLMFYKVNSMEESVISKVIWNMNMMFKEISYPSFIGLVSLSVSLWVLISLNNSLGLFPFIFTSTSHLVVTLSLGLIMWMSSFFMGWITNMSSSSAHLVPEGAPLILSPFMVMIESISHLIRPLTLSVRLAANMMAGHLIIGLVSSMSLLSLGGMMVSVMLQTLLLMLEWAVAFIQAFVFSVLILLYALDYY